PAVRKVLDLFVKRALDGDRPGCMVVNTAAELAPADSEAARRVQASWVALETGLASALTRARAQGELPADKDPHALASFLMVFIQGVLVVGKGDPNRERLVIASREALSILD